MGPMTPPLTLALTSLVRMPSVSTAVHATNPTPPRIAFTRLFTASGSFSSATVCSQMLHFVDPPKRHRPLGARAREWSHEEHEATPVPAPRRRSSIPHESVAKTRSLGAALRMHDSPSFEMHCRGPYARAAAYEAEHAPRRYPQGPAHQFTQADPLKPSRVAD